MKMPARIFLGLLVLALSGCLPEERFWWSPDGTRAAVVVNDQLHLVRADGELCAPLIGGLGAETSLMKRVSWLPDGSGMVVHRVRKLATWAEARVLIPDDELARIERLAATMPGLLKAAAVFAGDADSLETLLTALPLRDRELAPTAFLCAYEKETAAMKAALLAIPKGAAILEKMREEAAPFLVHEICLLMLRDDLLEGEPRTLVRSVNPVLLPMVSPKFPVVAYWRMLGEEEKVGLEVCTLEGQARVEVAQSNSATLDWSADGRSLVFAAPASGDDSLLHTIQRVTVLQESGALMEPRGDGGASPRKLAPPVDLALAILPSPPRLAALPDGRVLFASVPATLPAVSKAVNPEPRLFVISADGQSVQPVPTAPGDLPTNLSFFVVSPDGKRVAVVESATDAVAVVELATGRTEIVSPAHPDWQCRTLPHWKSATELTFAALSGPKGKPQWMLWSPGAGVRGLSDRWPPTATEDWLSQKKSADPVTVSPPTKRSSP